MSVISVSFYQTRRWNAFAVFEWQEITVNQFDKLTGLFLFFSMSTIGIEIWWLEILNCVCVQKWNMFWLKLIVCCSSDVSSSSISCLHQSDGCDQASVSTSIFSKIWNEVKFYRFFFYWNKLHSVVAFAAVFLLFHFIFLVSHSGKISLSLRISYHSTELTVTQLSVSDWFISR